jgi:hypothetical protein
MVIMNEESIGKNVMKGVLRSIILFDWSPDKDRDAER